MIDFTLSSYRKILETLKNSGYVFLTMNEWICKPGGRFVVIRHDVDRRAGNSLKTAVLEHSMGIRATYYFRMTKGSFKESIIRKISQMGHEVGYHYEDLSRNNGDMEKSISDFRNNLARLRNIAEVSTIAMHGNPSSSVNNLDMWKEKDFTEFGITGEAYLTPDYSSVFYFSDTGRNWRSNSRTNYRDYASGLKTDGITGTNDLIGLINKSNPEHLAIMTHPERWNSRFGGYIYYFVRDNFINFAKIILRPFIRKNKS